MAAPGGVRWVRFAATALVALPTVGVGAITLWQAGAEAGPMSLDRVFHLGSGLALLVLFCELAETISRSSRAPRILLLGGGGFAASLAAAIAVELLGPGALLALVLFTAGWAVAIAFAGREHGADPARADFARADE